MSVITIPGLSGSAQPAYGDRLQVIPEACPEPVTFQVESCVDTAAVDAEAALQSLGRIVQVDAVVKRVCPGRRVAVALLLTEVQADGTEQDRGMKVLVLPPQAGTVCQDVALKCVPFVVPEEPDGCERGSLCCTRTFRVRVLANYMDTDFSCCELQTVAL